MAKFSFRTHFCNFWSIWENIFWGSKPIWILRYFWSNFQLLTPRNKEQFCMCRNFEIVVTPWKSQMESIFWAPTTRNSVSHTVETITILVHYPNFRFLLLRSPVICATEAENGHEIFFQNWWFVIDSSKDNLQNKYSFLQLKWKFEQMHDREISKLSILKLTSIKQSLTKKSKVLKQKLTHICLGANFDDFACVDEFRFTIPIPLRAL